MKHEDLQYLLVDLPGDIRRLKDAGEFSHMRRVIEMRLSGEKLTEPMRKRLELELAMTQMLDAAYPYSAEEAAALAAGSIRDFTPAELEHYRDLDAADWIYVDAQVRYRRNFLTNLIKTRPELEARVLDEKRLNDQHSNRDMLEKMMAKMREKGGAAVKFRIRASVQVKPEDSRADSRAGGRQPDEGRAHPEDFSGTGPRGRAGLSPAHRVLRRRVSAGDGVSGGI